MYVHHLGGDLSLVGTFDSQGHESRPSGTGGFADGEGPFDYSPDI